MGDLVLCDFTGCKVSCLKGNFKRHKKTHDVNVKWFFCDECEYKSKNESNLKRHKDNKKWVFCDIPGCEFKCKSTGENKPKNNKYIKQHKLDEHGLKTWYFCDIGDCKYKSTQEHKIKTHKMNSHDLDVNWVYCEYPECEFKSKSNTNMTQHFNSLHTKEGQARQKREENKIKKLLIKNDISFERETIINYGCFDSGNKHRAFIDFVLYRKDCTILLECDENQHKYGRTASCDMKRMGLVITAIRYTENTLPILFLRYNPHNFKNNYVSQKVSTNDKQECLIKFLNEYQPSTKDLEIKYLFYDTEDGTPIICKTPEYNDLMKLCVI